MGDFEVVCKTKMLKEVRAETLLDSDEYSFLREPFLGAETTSKATVIEESSSDTDWNIKLLVNSSLVDLKNDTGADTTVMTYMKLQQRHKRTQSRQIVQSPG